MIYKCGIEKYKFVLMVLCIGIPLLIILNEFRKQIGMNKIFNFRRELKSIRKKKIKVEKKDVENSTLLGTTSGNKKIYTKDSMKHMFIAGTTGSGKTIALSNYIKSAIEKDYPLLIVDGKGDVGDNSILDIVYKLNYRKKIYIINMNAPERSDKYNPFANCNPTIIKDMLINMSEWSEEHYKVNTERYLQRLANLLAVAEIPLSFKTIIDHMPCDKFLELSATLFKQDKISKEEHISNAELAKVSGKIAENACARFSNLYESEIGQIFSQDGIDIYTAIQEKAIIVFILNPLIYPELTPLMGRLSLIDSKKAVSKLFSSNAERTFFIFDEINVYASNTFLDLINKSRSAQVTCILATQSLSDLDQNAGEYFKEQVVENCNNYLVLRQNSATNAEKWASILGTKNTMQVTYQLRQDTLNTTETGLGSARRAREFLFHPDEIKALKTGKGYFLSRDTGYHSKINVCKPY